MAEQASKEPNAQGASQIQELRHKIDALDEAILRILNERAHIAIQIGEVKHQMGTSVFKPEREQMIIDQLQAKNPGPLLPESVDYIWREIMSASRMLEQQQTVAFLGPVGTFSQLAMQKYFGHGALGVPQTSIDGVFQAIDQEKTSFAILPIENSTEGSVTRTLDLLIATNAKIVGEISIPVQHHLLYCLENLHDAPENLVVCGHPQALAQCQVFLQQHPHLQYCERQAVASNGLAAEIAHKNPKFVAIGSAHAAKQHQLHILESDIQDDYHNRTRFSVLGYNETRPTGKDQSSFILAVPNQAGAILKVLQPLANYGVSMCRLESRPARKSFTWEYIFMIDVEGHIDQTHVAEALRQIQQHSEFYKFLGSYAKAD